MKPDTRSPLEGFKLEELRKELMVRGAAAHARVTAVMAGAKENLAGNAALASYSSSDIAKALRAADLFVMSSAYEGMPIAVLEALATGVPVVSTDVGELRLVVRDGVNYGWPYCYQYGSKILADPLFKSARQGRGLCRASFPA